MLNTIIHCDDDPFVLEFVKLNFEMHDITCLSYPSGETLISEVQAHSPDLVLLDQQMLPLSGMELAQLMALHCPTIPVIFISGDKSILDNLPCNVAGEIVKPFNVETFIDDIMALLNAFSARCNQQSVVEPSPEIEGLRQRYVQSLQSQMEDLSTAMHSYFSYCAVEQLHTSAKVCHRIVGTSGLYGLNTVSSAAAVLEDAVDVLCNSENKPSTAELDAVSSMLSELESAVQTLAQKEHE